MTPQTHAEVQVVTFIDAFPGREVTTIASGLRLTEHEVLGALDMLDGARIVYAEVRSTEFRRTIRYYPTGAWCPDQDGS